MDRKTIWRVIGLLVIAVGIAAIAYHLGVSQGVAESGHWAAQVPPGAVHMYGWHPWAHGFFLFPLLFVLVLLFAFKGGRRGCDRHHRWCYRDEGVPPAFEEWHRRAHGQSLTPPASSDPVGR